MSKLYLSDKPCIMLNEYALRLSQPLIAPDASDKLGCATTRLGSKKVTLPKPSHSGHAPIGLLNENRRGSNSAIA